MESLPRRSLQRAQRAQRARRSWTLPLRACARARRGALIGAILGVSALCVVGRVLAQTSASYDMKAHVVNEGGHPFQGVALASTSFRMGLDAVGQGLYAPGLGSASFTMGVGFASPYLAPGEVFGVKVLADRKTLMWMPEPAADHYHVYRDLLPTLPGAYGLCWAAPVPSTSVVDNALPAVASGFFYLVTSDTSLGIEGTKGRNSAGVERANPAPCP